MGCCTQRSKSSEDKQSKGKINVEEAIPPLEIKIIDAEKLLSFKNLESKEAIKCLKTESLRESLSLSQLKRAFLELQIPQETLNEIDDANYQVYNKLRIEHGLYDLKKFTLLSLLIGKGELKEKAEWLFKLFDEDAQGTLSSNEVANMVDSLAHLSIEVLPIAVSNETLNEADQVLLKKYVETLKLGRDHIQREVKKLLGSESIAESEFVAKVSASGSLLNNLLWSQGIRLLARRGVNQIEGSALTQN